MELEAVRAVRGMFRAWGIDPARYRPSSEALLRRVAQGKGLYRVSNVVDAGNLGSLETGWPYGIYNRALISGPVIFREGLQSETYEGIGKKTWHLAGRPVLADSGGAFGSPISDSTRTMVTEAARDILAVIYAPASAPRPKIEQALADLARRLEIRQRGRTRGLRLWLRSDGNHFFSFSRHGHTLDCRAALHTTDSVTHFSAILGLCGLDLGFVAQISQNHSPEMESNYTGCWTMLRHSIHDS